MKRLMLFSLSVLFALNVFSQKISTEDVPAKVMSSYYTKVPDSLPATWEKTDNSYTARFTRSDLKAQMTFSESSEWIRTQWELPAQYLPKKIQEYIATNYPKYKIKTTEIEYKAGGEFYLVGLKLKKDNPILRFTIKSVFVGIDAAVPPSDHAK